MNLIFNQNARLAATTAGERRFARLLKTRLDDETLCWFNVPVGSPPRYPDFVLVHPRRGLLVLEVKDWRAASLARVDKFRVTLRTGRGAVEQNNPLEQARQYLLQLTRLLEADPALRQTRRHRGKLCLPFGYGAVLSKITRRQFDAGGLGAALDPERVLCRDDIADGVDATALRERLWRCVPYAFTEALTPEQLDRVRWHIFPDVRVGHGELFPELDADAERSADERAPPDLIRVMDLEQEKLARRIGDGHRVIHGVAGSGKTMILGYRCAHLAQAVEKPILVLCYNVALAAKLTAMVADKGLAGRVDVDNFHRWCGAQLRRYGVARPASGDGYADRLAAAACAAARRGTIPAAQYGAVLIDEAHDFEADWLRLLLHVLDPDSGALLVLYDDAQSIYRRGLRCRSFAEVGVQARGRTRILKINYRNTEEILATAYAFARELFDGDDGDGDAPAAIRPEINIGRHGPPPELVARPDLAGEAGYLAARLTALHDAGRAWRDVAVLYRSQALGRVLAERLAAAGLPVEWLNRDARSRRYRPGDASVKLMTMHSSKGLEFPVVAIAGLGEMPLAAADPGDEARLLYVAMTRAMDRLIMTYSRRGAFIKRLHRALDAASR